MNKNQIKKRLQEIRQRMRQLEYQRDHAGRESFNREERAEANDLMHEHEKLSLQFETPLSLESGSFSTQRRSESGPFSSLGEQLRAIVDTSSGTKPIDERLLHIDAEYRATGLGESIPSQGEFLIQPDFRQDILTNIWGEGEIMRRCRQIPITVGNSLKWPFTDESARTTGNRRGSLRGYWVDEATEHTASKPKFGQHSLHLHKCAVLVYCTDEILEDSRALEEYIRVEGANEIKFMVEDAIVNGLGAGMPQGLLNASCKVTVDKEAGQAATTVTLQNVIDMWARLPGNLQKNAVWLCNQNVLPQLYQMSLTIGDAGSAVFLPSGGVSSQPYASLFARPLIPTEYCQTLGTEGDLILTDLSQYLLATKGNIQTDMSIHFRFVYSESVFRILYRVDGMSAWNTSVTPFKGSGALSPVITLQTRS